MSKEYLEALDYVWYNYYTEELSEDENDEIVKHLKIVETALQRLESIDNAKPSEALECLEEFINEMTRCLENPKEYVKGYEKQIFWKYKNTLETTIKQALLKQQEREKFFDDKLVFKNGCIMSGFDYKGKQIVTMPLEKYDEFMKQEKAQEPKQYLKWEDLEFYSEWKCKAVKLNGTKYKIKYKCDFDFFNNYYQEIVIYSDDDRTVFAKLRDKKQFFNDLHLERVEE